MGGAAICSAFFDLLALRCAPARRRAAVLCALTLTALTVGAAPVRAHAIVDTTEPAAGDVVEDPPSRVFMRFNEPVELAFGAIRVFDAAGRRVDEGDAAYVPGRPHEVEVGLLRDLPHGTYTVSWRIISADSHPISEAYVFHVGAPGAEPRGVVDEVLAGGGPAGRTEAFLLGVTRWANFVALLTLVGALLFLPLVWRRRSGTLARPTQVERRFHSRWVTLVRWSWVALVAGTLLSLWLQGAVAGDTALIAALSPTVVSEVLGTRFGALAVTRLGILAVGAAAWSTARNRLSEPLGAPSPVSVGAGALAPAPPRWLVGAALVVSAALALTPGLAGHAGTTPPVAVNLATDAGHVLAAAVWLGGLMVLLWAVLPATRGLGDGDRVRTLAPVVARYSQVAVVAVAVLVVTGTYRGWVEVRSVSALGEPYSLALLVKLAAFLPLLALGAVNNRWTKPRMDAAAAGGFPDARPLSLLRRLVGVEVALGILVVAITAVLVNLPPARVTAAAGAGDGDGQQVTMGEHSMTVSVTPNRVGDNRVEVRVAGHDDMPGGGMHATEGSGMGHGASGGLAGVTVNFTMAEQDIGPLVAEAEEAAPGRWVVTGRHLSVPGTWTLEVVARVGRFDEERASVEVVVPR